MSINCKELYELFYKVGGKLTCNYDTKECRFDPQKIICKDMDKYPRELDTLIWETTMNKFTSHKNNLVKYIKDYDYKGKTIHSYQMPSNIGFEISFKFDEDGNRIPT